VTSAPEGASTRLRGLGDLELIVVTGKGGVGKSTMAAGIAEALHRSGKSVLLCDIEAGSGAAQAFELDPLSFTPTEIRPGFSAMAMDTEASLREYLKIYLRIPIIGKISPLAKAFDFVATAAPGVREVLTVGKLCYEVRERHYDVVVVDAPSSGYVTSLLNAPETIQALAQVGLIRSQTDWMLEILHDQQRTGVVCVTTPEEMPVTETMELLDRLAEQTAVAPSLIVANRVLPESFNLREREAFDALTAARGLAAVKTSAGELGLSALSLARAVEGIRRQRMAQLGDLLEGIGDLDIALIPELFAVPSGLRMTSLIADALIEELT